MTVDELAMAVEALADDAGANDRHDLRVSAIADVIRTEIRRLYGDDVGPVPTGTRARKGWALTPEGFARALNRLTTNALGARASGLPVATIAATLREQIARMDKTK